MEITKIKWYEQPTTIIILLIIFFPIGIFLMWKNELWTKKTRWIVTSIFAFLIIVNANKNESANKININDSSSKVTFNEAQSFMQNRCNSIGQTLMKSKTVNFSGTQLYMFLSVAENGEACISSVSENKLEVLAVDCGSAEMKVSDWNALK